MKLETIRTIAELMAADGASPQWVMRAEAMLLNCRAQIEKAERAAEAEQAMVRWGATEAAKQCGCCRKTVYNRAKSVRGARTITHTPEQATPTD